MKMRMTIFLVVTGIVVVASDSVPAQTWIQTASPALFWNAVASSADGKTLIGVVDGGDIYTSTKGGAAWSSNGVYMHRQSVTTSADGKRIVAAGFAYNTNFLFCSADSGETWISNTVPSSLV